MAPSLSPSTIHILKSTAPVVKSEGTKITSRMYEIMFDRYPVVNNLFNTTHIRKTGDTNSVPPQVQKMNYKLKKYFNLAIIECEIKVSFKSRLI